MTTDLADLLADLRRDYLASFPAKIEKLRALLAAHEIQSLTDEFHKLKGTGKTYGVAEISLVSELAEAVCETQPQEIHWAIPAALEFLQQIYQTHSRLKDGSSVTKHPDFIKMQQLFNR